MSNQIKGMNNFNPHLHQGQEKGQGQGQGQGQKGFIPTENGAVNAPNIARQLQRAQDIIKKGVQSGDISEDAGKSYLDNIKDIYVGISDAKGNDGTFDSEERAATGEQITALFDSLKAIKDAKGSEETATEETAAA